MGTRALTRTRHSAGIGPCAGGLPVDPTIVPMCIAAMAERCAREQAADTEWIFTRGGFAGFVYSNLTRFQIGSIFAATTFGPCNIIFQQGQNVTVHSAWTRTYTCRGTTYSGVEAVETVLDPRTQLVTWNWIANEPLWAGLGDCIASLI